MRSLFLAVALTGLTGLAGAQNLMDQQRLDEARRHYRIGEELMLTESFEDAAREFKAAVELDPAFSLAHYSLGQAQMALKRFPAAVEAYTSCRDTFLRASSLDQKARADIEARTRDEVRELEDSLARLREGKIKGATPGQEVGIEQRIRLLKDSQMRGAEQGVRIPAEVSLALGSAYFRMGKYESAEEQYRAAIAADSKLGAAHNNLAVIHMLSGRLAEAEREMKLAEKSGFTVSPQFKDDLKAKLKAQKN
jgi:tetratricopeptide (TPR) repeat protein